VFGGGTRVALPPVAVRQPSGGEETMEDRETHEKKSKSVYTILERPGRKPYWMKIGIAHLNSDSSWNVYLDVIPFDRKLQIREDDGKYARPQAERGGGAMSSFEVGGIQ
jgi:hypothetical protein